MDKRILGKTGLSVSVLGFGGAEIGFEHADRKTVQNLLAEALDSGLNVIDTAECYLNSEELIGSGLGTKRADIYLFTKCGHGKDYNDGLWTIKDITASLERSLMRLKTDYLDLLQLHSCSTTVLKQGEAIEGLIKAKQSGKTRFIGYSGDGQDALYAVNTGIFDTLQTSINIADQQALSLTLPIALEKGMGIIAKRPIANAAFRYKSKPDNDYHIPYWERLQKLKYDFTNGNQSNAASYALRFTLSVTGVSTAIVGTAKIARYRENSTFLQEGLLSPLDFNAIRDRWQAVATDQWIGQV